MRAEWFLIFLSLIFVTERILDRLISSRLDTPRSQSFISERE